MIYLSLMNEYINKRLDLQELREELNHLIKAYNQKCDSYLLIYSSAISKPRIPKISMDMQDYHVIHDLLRDNKGDQLDVYLETPGGQGEAAEEIGRFITEKFESVSFVISGEAKSAGTILALSGNKILMTKSGSLGPIDAQVTVGRSTVSAYDYIEWVDKIREEAEEEGELNPFDAQMVAQISPGELESVNYALEFAKELVREWLPRNKFRDWDVTDDRGLEVTEEMKEERAEEIAESLTDHEKWLSHGRSLKISDLEEIGLQIGRIDEDQELAEIVYRIQTVIRLIFHSSSTYKIFATEDNYIGQQAVRESSESPTPGSQNGGDGEEAGPDGAQITIECDNCGREHKIFAKFKEDVEINDNLKEEGFIPYPESDKIICECGYELDLRGVKNEIEARSGLKVIPESEEDCSDGE